MQTFKRLNANIPVNLYIEAKTILNNQGKSLTGYVVEALEKTVKEHKMSEMIELYNKLADTPCTEEAIIWEESCSLDGLSREEKG